MEKFAILARVEPKPGKENDVLEFLKSALPLAEGEPGTVRWYALQIGPSTFGIFDTFGTTDARDGRSTCSKVSNRTQIFNTVKWSQKFPQLHFFYIIL